MGLLAMCACEEGTREAGPLQTSSLFFDKGAIDHANVQLDMKAGELNVGGTTDKLMEGQFDFNSDASKPRVQNRLNGTHASITIEQPKVVEFGNHGRNTWNIRLNDQVVLDLSFHCGAGKAKMRLGSLKLRSLEVHMGAGKVDLDLNGHPTQDYEVDIAGGIGEATIRLPQGVGIRADVHGGIGDIKVNGLEKKGDHYENDMFDTAKVSVRLKVSGGIGEIRILD